MVNSQHPARQREADLLAEIGRCLHSQDLRVQVRLPATLASQAVAGWEREDDAPVEDETTQQRALRHQVSAAVPVADLIFIRAADVGMQNGPAGGSGGAVLVCR